mgnify:CR=1 FL=1
MKLQEFNMDTLEECSPFDREEALSIYHDWLKRQRKIDREFRDREHKGVYRFKNRERIRSYNRDYKKRKIILKPILTRNCLFCNSEFQTNRNDKKYCCLRHSSDGSARRYRELHKIEIKKRSHESYLKNKEKNREKRLISSREYYRKHREEILKKLKNKREGLK